MKRTVTALSIGTAIATGVALSATFNAGNEAKANSYDYTSMDLDTYGGEFTTTAYDLAENGEITLSDYASIDPAGANQLIDDAKVITKRLNENYNREEAAIDPSSITRDLNTPPNSNDFSRTLEFESVTTPTSPPPVVTVKPSNDNSYSRATNYSYDQLKNINQYQAFTLAEQVIGVPADLLNRIAFNESTNDPTAVNPYSGACGLGQLMPDTTLPEMAYKYGDLFGLPVGSLVETFNAGRRNNLPVIGHRAVEGKRSEMLNECLDEWTNVSLVSMNLIEKMRRVDNRLNQLGKTINHNQADLYIGHFLGARADIMLAYRERPNALVKDIVLQSAARTQEVRVGRGRRARTETRRIVPRTSATIEQNRAMFYHPNGQPRTVANLYEYIGKQGYGPDKNVNVQPFWNVQREEIATRLQNTTPNFG